MRSARKLAGWPGLRVNPENPGKCVLRVRIILVALGGDTLVVTVDLERFDLAENGRSVLRSGNMRL